MKKAILFHWLFLLFYVPSQAQVGDISLEQKQDGDSRRVHKKVSADPGLRGNSIRNFLVGRNYRAEWLDTVTVPVLKFRTDFGGLTPTKEGGGKQTRTLYLQDGSGREWVLRSVRKYPEKATPPELRGTLAERLIKDGISGSYPYSVLSTGTLSRAAGIPYFPNTLVYVADDPALGEFRSGYKNTLALLELRTIDATKKEEPWDTEELVPRLLASADHGVDQQAVLRLRLLDNFIMDFDRHEGQWVWVEKDSAGRKFYFPIAKDRDQAFFNLQGLLARMVSGQPPMGIFQGLSHKMKDITTFNYSVRDFDRVFLNELNEQAWTTEVDRFLAAMTDEVIEEAMARQPAEVQDDNTAKIGALLKAKRAHFREEMLAYYRFLSATVSVTGSNDAELITLTPAEGGSLLLHVQKLQDDGTPSFTTYQRLFDPAVTREVRVYGLEGEDKFLVREGNSPIKVRLVGGPGPDSFLHEGGGSKVLVYDVSFEPSKLIGRTGIKNRISADPMNNEYRRLGTTYASASPGIYAEWPPGSLLLGLSYTITRPGFRKEPYGTRHFMYATRALNSPSYHLRYEGDFIGVARKMDLLIRTDMQAPTVSTNFFGLGNNSFFDKANNLDHYRAWYYLGNLSVMARHTLNPWLQLQYGPVLQYFQLADDRNHGKYIQQTFPTGEKQSHLYEGTWYAGGEFRLEANTKNNPVLPSRGMQATTYARVLKSFTEESVYPGQVGGSLSLYTDRLLKDRIILCAALGVDHNMGNFEFYQAHYLGFKQNLRGYRFQRFAGRTRAYNNLEARVNFGEANFYLFKAPVGVLGFHDTGRVWTDDESSSTWHRGYGGGIWIAPFSKLVVNASMMFSPEEKGFPFVMLGFQF